MFNCPLRGDSVTVSALIGELAGCSFQGNDLRYSVLVVDKPIQTLNPDSLPYIRNEQYDGKVKSSELGTGNTVAEID